MIYGYIFRIAETQEVVYVGQGDARRASNKSVSRNRKFNFLRDKHPVVKEIIFETESLEEMNKWEDDTIMRYHTWIDDPSATCHACNIKRGGSNGKQSTESRKRMSDAWRRRGPMTEETRKRLSEAGRRRFEDPVERAKLSDTHRNPSLETRKKISDAGRGRPKSDETRKRMSDALRGRPVSPETRKKMSDAMHVRKLSPDSLKKMCSPRRCPLCGGTGHFRKTCARNKPETPTETPEIAHGPNR
jgi:hypothetical protein